MVIDFHTHTFPEKIAAGAVAGLRRSGGVKSFSDGTAAGLSASMKRSGIDLAVNLPVMTRPDQVPHVNGSLIRRSDELRGAGIVTFGGMHPLYDGWADEIKALAAAGIPGIKLHPAERCKNAFQRRLQKPFITNADTSSGFLRNILVQEFYFFL